MKRVIITPAADSHRSSSMTSVRGALALALLVALCGAASAQEPAQMREALEVGPPPLKYIPEETRQRLAGTRNLKDRVKLGLTLADERLTAAASHVNGDRFMAATAELGIYEAVIVDTLRFVQSSGPVSNKQRDLFKRIEQALRSHTSRIETIRRSLPAAHGYHAGVTIEFVRDARTDALNAFFSDTVLRSHPPVAPGIGAGERMSGTASASTQEQRPQQ